MSTVQHILEYSSGILFLITAFMSYREYVTNPYKCLFKDCWIWKVFGLTLMAFSSFLTNPPGIYVIGGMAYCVGAISYNTIRILRRKDRLLHPTCCEINNKKEAI